MYLASPGRPTEIGLQLDKACFPCSITVRVEEECFYSSVSLLSFIFLILPCLSLSSPLLSFLYLFPLSLGDNTK